MGPHLPFQYNDAVTQVLFTCQ